MLSVEEVKHIAKLASLPLAEEEIPLYQEWLSEVLDYVKVLDELDVDETSPTYQVTETEGVYRDDIEDIGQHLTQEEALVNVPFKQEKGYFKIDKVVWE